MFFDLIKAFERVPLDILVREAIALGYPLRILKLSLAAYRLLRVLGVSSVIAEGVIAVRGLTAGSGFAQSEMMISMVHAVERALAAHPQAQPTLRRRLGEALQPMNIPCMGLCQIAWCRHGRRQ